MAQTAAETAPEPRGAIVKRSVAIGVIAFLTLIDLFGAQALAPLLVDAYGVSAAEVGVAVNASTIGMAIAGLATALFARSIDRKIGVAGALALLSAPTFALAFVDDLALFGALRVIQGVFMAVAFTLTLTYLSEVCTTTAARGAMAAYITGNVASNLFGRLLATGAVEVVGLPGTFIIFAALNLSGAIFAYLYFRSWSDGASAAATMSDADGVRSAFRRHLSDARLRASFAIGFLILFVFIGVFTYVNFELAGRRFALEPTQLGLVYFVFVPAILTTPLAAGAVGHYGSRGPFFASMLVTLVGVAMLLSSALWVVLIGLALVGAALFFAQAAATGFVGRIAQGDHAAANGLYLTSYYLGGVGGAIALGQIYAAAGWSGAVLAFAAASALCAALGLFMTERPRDAA